MAYSVGAGGASVIDRDSTFSGNFHSPRDLRIEGEYEGEIQCDGTLTVADSARVSGTVHAGNVSVSGVLQGQIDCSGRFEIHETGQVSARVVAGTVVIREGAFYEGEMRMQLEPAGLAAREFAPFTAVPTSGVEETPSDEPPQLNSRATVREGADLHAVPATADN
ncbi:MAG: bactofilin family protein [Dehalococcoidia bacterium]